jgi:hypothetical protein
MPNETHLKRLISDAVFEAHNTHGRQAAGDRLHISREDSRIIASAVFDTLRRANVLLIEQPGHSTPEAWRGIEWNAAKFIMLLGGPVAWPLTARAQQVVMPVVGILYAGSSAGVSPTYMAAFRKGLEEAGFAEGQNVAFDFRFAEAGPSLGFWFPYRGQAYERLRASHRV